MWLLSTAVLPGCLQLHIVPTSLQRFDASHDFATVALLQSAGKYFRDGAVVPFELAMDAFRFLAWLPAAGAFALLSCPAFARSAPLRCHSSRPGARSTYHM